MTPWVLRLLVANVAIFIVTMAVPVLLHALLLVPALVLVRPWTVVSYMFLHANLWHLLFNMIGLFFFGPRLEVRLGSRHFLGLYFFSGIVAALASLLTPWAAIVGASGAVFGILLAFARYWPTERIFIWGVLPIQARWFVIILTVLSLWGGVGGTMGGVAHFAHLGGFLGGFLYLKWVERRSPAARFRKKLEPKPQPRLGDSDLKRWRRIRLEELHPINRDEIERILAKVERDGAGSLSPRERELLDRFSSG